MVLKRLTTSVSKLSRRSYQGEAIKDETLKIRKVTLDLEKRTEQVNEDLEKRTQETFKNIPATWKKLNTSNQSILLRLNLLGEQCEELVDPI